MTYFLLSFHGRVVGHLEGKLAQIKLEDVEDFGTLVKLILPHSVTSASRFDHFISNGSPISYDMNVPGLGNVVATFNIAYHEITFSKNGLYMCAEPSGSITCNRPYCSFWETFLVVDEILLEQIRYILNNRWVILSRRQLVSREQISLAPGPMLVCGDLRLPLKYNLPFDPQSFPFRFPIYTEGWRLDQLVLYDPLAFYVAKGKDAVEQLIISISSLVRIGKFDGKIALYTDASLNNILQAAPDVSPDNIVILDHPSRDWVGFVAGKYSILEEEVAQSCAPVVYFDPDIIFNAPIQQMFIDMVSAGRPTAPLEHFSKMATSPSVGAELLREDNASVSIASGFNAGTFAVPNLQEFGYVFRAIRSVITNYLNLHGREALRWVDQEAANYVSYRLAHVDTSDVSKYVRYGWLDDAYRLGVLSGLVHFCGIRRQDRVGPMRHYYRMLNEHYTPASLSERV